MADAQLPWTSDVKDGRLRTDAGFQQLVMEHQALDARIQQLSTFPHLSDQQQFEETALKKQKLALKDRIEAIRRLQPPATGAPPAPLVTIDRAAAPFVAIACLPAALAAWAGVWPVAVALLVVPIAIALFFRDPDRVITMGAPLVLVPADGRVMHAGPARPDEAPPGAWQQVTIFLSLLDVHVNRTPVAGVVTRVDYLPGTFLAAYRAEAHRNERSEIWLDHGGQTIVVRQVVGLLARRVVCRIKTGDALEAGARIGLMKFGSRMDVFVPLSASLRVAAGDMVRAGQSVIASLASE